MPLAFFAALAILDTSRGYVASFAGQGQLVHGAGKTVPLSAESLRNCVRLFTGDRITLSSASSKAVLILDGRRVRLAGNTAFSVPSELAQVGELASRTVLAGRGAGAGDKPAPFEKLAIFARQDSEDAVGNMTVFSDGSLPVVWVHDELAQSVRITLQVDGAPGISIGPIPAAFGGTKGYPFGVANSKVLGEYLSSHVSDAIAQLVTLSVTDDKGRTNKTIWEIQKRAEFNRSKTLFAASAVDEFESFDAAVQVSEGGKGGSKSPSYPGIKAALVYGYFAKHQDTFIALEMLHFLTLTNQFPGIELALKKQLEVREKG